eukprot:1182573-Prorocentrum_minimum.AAC.1
MCGLLYVPWLAMVLYAVVSSSGVSAQAPSAKERRGDRSPRRPSQRDMRMTAHTPMMCAIFTAGMFSERMKHVSTVTCSINHQHPPYCQRPPYRQRRVEPHVALKVRARGGRDYCLISMSPLYHQRPPPCIVNVPPLYTTTAVRCYIPTGTYLAVVLAGEVLGLVGLLVAGGVGDGRVGDHGAGRDLAGVEGGEVDDGLEGATGRALSQHRPVELAPLVATPTHEDTDGTVLGRHGHDGGLRVGEVSRLAVLIEQPLRGLLPLEVHGGVDLQPPPPVKELLAQLLLQVVEHLRDEEGRAVRGAVHGQVGGAGGSRGERVRQALLLLLLAFDLRDEASDYHAIEDLIAGLERFLGVAVGGEVLRRREKSSQYGCLAYGQVFRLLFEISGGRLDDPDGTVAVVHVVEIRLDDFGL